jgi:hypothetical protein
MGMTGENAQTLSTNTAKLALDLASLTNVPINQVMSDLRAGLVGQSETVYKYGIDVTEAAIKAEALAQGIDKSVRNMSQGEKMFLRHVVMMKQTAIAHGDMARTIETPANQLRMLSQRVATLTRNIGTLFIPMLTRILPWLNAIVIVLNRVIERLAILSGYEPPPIRNVPSPFTKMSGDIDDAIDGVDKLKNAIRQLSGFDELNIFSESTSASGGLGAIAGMFDLDLASMYEYDNLMGNLRQQADDIADRIQPAMEKVLDVVINIGKFFLAWKVIEPLVRLFSAVIPAGTVLGGFLSLGTLATGSLVLLTTHLYDLYKNNEKFRKGLERVKEVFDPLWENLTKGLGEIKTKFLELLPPSVSTGLETFFEKISELVELLDLDFSDLAVTIAGVGLLFTPLAPLGVAILVVEGLSVALRGLGGVSDETWEDMKIKVGTVLGKHIKNDIEQFTLLLEDLNYFMSGKFSTDFKDALDGINRKSIEIFNGFPTPIINAFNTVINAINAVLQSLNQIRFDVPDWVADLLGIKKGSTIGFQFKQIPLVGDGFGVKNLLQSPTSGGFGFSPQTGGGVGSRGSGDVSGYNYNPQAFTEQMAQSIIDATAKGQTTTQIIENILNLDGEVIYKNQQTVKRNAGFNLGGGAFAR